MYQQLHWFVKQHSFLTCEPWVLSLQNSVYREYFDVQLDYTFPVFPDTGFCDESKQNAFSMRKQILIKKQDICSHAFIQPGRQPAY